MFHVERLPLKLLKGTVVNDYTAISISATMSGKWVMYLQLLSPWPSLIQVAQT